MGEGGRARTGVGLLSDKIVEFYERLYAWETSLVDESGLSLPHLHLLEVLGIHGPLKMKDLSDKLGVTTGTLTVSIDKLEGGGFVRRVANPNDRRSWLIELTEKGQATHQRHSAHHLDLAKGASSGFSPAEIQQFSQLLHRFMDGI